MTLAELRLRIFRLLEERQRERSDLPTAGEIARAVEEPLRNVVVTLRSSEAMGMVELVQCFGEEDKDVSVYLKPPAYIYLESNLIEPETR
jgi:DNA-binding transcriptional ArsR family regulator